MPSRTNEPGAIFECRQCGDCCRGYGGTFVSKRDIDAIASFLGTDPKSFVANYCRLSGKRPLLTQKEDGYCIFWDRICTIHPVKPQMCRRWPFIESVLRDVANWRIMASMCPGMMAEAPGSRVEECVRKAFRDESTDSIKRRHQEATGSPYPKTVSSGEPPSPCTRSGHSHRIKRGR
jgi:Fe-S-cluster containining protein